MAIAVTPNWARIARDGTLAGLVGGFAIDLFIYVTSVLPTHASMLAVWQWIASTAIGKTAFSAPGYAWLGLALHALVSVSWGIGYAYLAHTRDFINRSTVASGIGFGFVVFVVMQIVLLGDNNFHFPNPTELGLDIVAHCAFFGLPVALVTKAAMQRA